MPDADTTRATDSRSSEGASSLRRFGRALRITGSVDPTRERTASLNQMLLGAVVLARSILVVIGSFPGDVSLLFVGVVIVFILTGATLIIPWNRIPLGWMALVPTLDIVAILIMWQSSPESSFGLLWIFPTTWLAGGFGLIGMYGVMIGVSGVFCVSVLLDPRQTVTYTTFLLPLVIVALAATSYLTARRTSAQRTLLARQAQLLRQVLERTRRQEQEVTEVLDAVDFGVIRIGHDGTIAVTNEAHGRLQQAILEAETDADSSATAYRDDGVTALPRDELPVERALRGEAFDGQVVWFGDPAGDRRALSVTARRVRDTSGRDAGAVVISRDVTSEATALRVRDDLVASVSHELRTPLTSILGYLDLAIDDPAVPESSRKNLEIAERNAERLLGIVADILAASSSSPSSIELSMSLADIDVADVARAAIESLVPRAAERAVTIDGSGLEPAHAYADPQRLRQVIDNLIANGIKYNRDGGTVAVGTTTDGRSTWILVRDTGVGISEVDRARLFQRYYRGNAVRGSGMHGTGLGLAISRDIVRAHGGEIALRSSPGVGSTFIVKLPAHQPAQEGADL
ncbi:MAG: PAS domain-containing sensor histidine kinase [Actinobacteria bacterium]|nr:PAS domain-containing sensor histidine kinase [Actinomycetota bacterium]